MGKQWVREQVRKDMVQDSVDKGVRWVDENRSRAAAWVGGGVLAVLVGIVAIVHLRSAHDQAWTRLWVAEGMAYSGQAEKSLEQLKTLTSEQPGSEAAAFGQLFSGDIAFSRGDYKASQDYYSAVLDQAKPQGLLPLALNDTAIAQESAGQYQQAQQSAQRFLDQYPDHYLAPQVHACLARAQIALGQLDAAKTTLQKIALQYPDTSWAAWAQARLQPAK